MYVIGLFIILTLFYEHHLEIKHQNIELNNATSASTSLPLGKRDVGYVSRGSLGDHHLAAMQFDVLP